MYSCFIRLQYQAVATLLHPLGHGVKENAGSDGALKDAATPETETLRHAPHRLRDLGGGEVDVERGPADGVVAVVADELPQLIALGLKLGLVPVEHLGELAQPDVPAENLLLLGGRVAAFGVEGVDEADRDEVGLELPLLAAAGVLGGVYSEVSSSVRGKM